MRLEEEAEPPAEDDLVLLEDDAVYGDGQISLRSEEFSCEPRPDDELIPLDDDAASRHEQIPLDDAAAYQERGPRDQAAHEHTWLYDGDGQESAPDRFEEPQGPQPLRRGATTRYRVHATAFAVAIAFVALAGFGLGVLSGSEDVAGPLTRDTVRAAPTEPTGQNARRAQPQQPAELSALATVRVAPAPVAAVSGTRLSTSAPPLPPPPKPALPPSATGKAASTDRQLDSAAAALPEAEAAGGPFEPLFAKLPASRPTQTPVLVHYTASGVGAPATAMHLVRHLKADGFAVEARPVEFAIPTNSIRYFFDADRKQAEALRSSLKGQIPDGAALSVLDFTAYEPRPRPGLVEIWLST
jgi:hypothetical protein